MLPAGVTMLSWGPAEGGGAQPYPGAGPGNGGQHPQGCGSCHGILAPAGHRHCASAPLQLQGATLCPDSPSVAVYDMLSQCNDCDDAATLPALSGTRISPVVELQSNINAAKSDMKPIIQLTITVTTCQPGLAWALAYCSSSVRTNRVTHTESCSNGPQRHGMT